MRLVQYHGVAKPGVHVLGVDVGGKSRAQIAKLVSDWDAHPVTITVGERSYHVQRGWLVSVDAAVTAQRALSAGSAFALVSPKRVDVKPVLGRADSAHNVLTALARSNRDPVSATVAPAGHPRRPDAGPGAAAVSSPTVSWVCFEQQRLGRSCAVRRQSPRGSRPPPPRPQPPVPGHWSPRRSRSTTTEPTAVS